MLIDNKTSFYRNEPHTLYDFFVKNIEYGELDIVTGYFSIDALAKFFDTYPLNTILKMRLILGDLVFDNGQLSERNINLLSERGDAHQAFFLTASAKKAIAFLEQSKVEIKTIQKNFCHAKAYIFKDSKTRKNHFYSIGSSNLTAAGLGFTHSPNIELNTTITGGEQDYDNVSKWFGGLWNDIAKDTFEDPTRQRKRVAVKEALIEKIQTLFQEYSPEFLYNRVLYELFKDDFLAWVTDREFNKRLEHLKNTVLFQTLFPFQQRGTLSLIKMLQRQNGAILADAVGLGKTWQALAVMKFFQTQGYEILLLCPKKLENNWLQYQSHKPSKFRPDKLRYFVRAHSDLQDNRLDKYSDAPLSYFQDNEQLLIVIDESHNLRNDKSGRYQFLVEHILSKNKDVKVLLLSATPINNSLMDIRNQFKLMVKGNDRGFAETDLNVKSLEGLFSKSEREFATWVKQPDSTVAQLMQKLDKLCNFTDKFIVARTRDLIKKYASATGAAGSILHFPTKLPPQNEFVTPTEIGVLANFSDIIELLETINLTAYRAAQYKTAGFSEAISVVHDASKRQGFLVRMMFILMLKRLESSWSSFFTTIQNVYNQHARALAKVDKFIAAHEYSSLDSELDMDTLNSLLEEFDEDELVAALDSTIGKKSPISLQDIDIIRFRTDLAADCGRLQTLLNQLSSYQQQITANQLHDVKLARLVEIIQQKHATNPCRKVLIFTTYADTARYLYEGLYRSGFSNIACVTGQDSWDSYGYRSDKDFTPILEKFAPYTKLYTERDWTTMYQQLSKGEPAPNMEVWKNLLQQYAPHDFAKLMQPLDILIATDCLSEGQNLQDCDCVINYDIHWNPVRLIQRMGRIDRIGSKHAEIMGINFWPAKDYDELLKLKTRVEQRMALMTLIGSEITPTDEKLAEEIAKNPLLSQQENRMLEQLQTTWEDIEAGDKAFGLDDLSLEEFRQELFDIFERKAQEFEQTPLGAFTGFNLSAQHALFPPPVPSSDGMVAFVGFPKRTVWRAGKTMYDELYLVYVSNDKKYIVSEQRAVLEFLRTYKHAARSVPHAVDTGETPAIQHYQRTLHHWFETQQRPNLHDLFSLAELNDDSVIEEKFKPQNFDLLCWFAIQPPPR